MKRYGFIILILVFALYLTGCAKKENPVEETQEFMSMEELGSALNQESVAPAETKIETAQAPTTATMPQIQPEPPVPAGPYKPSPRDIQTALKNAGYYGANIDGKIGPLTKKAIEEFQKANSLKVDGKVGPKTWELLSKYLTPTTEAATPVKKR